MKRDVESRKDVKIEMQKKYYVNGTANLIPIVNERF
jgi:hypothetical protein